MSISITRAVVPPATTLRVVVPSPSTTVAFRVIETFSIDSSPPTFAPSAPIDPLSNGISYTDVFLIALISLGSIFIIGAIVFVILYKSKHRREKEEIIFPPAPEQPYRDEVRESMLSQQSDNAFNDQSIGVSKRASKHLPVPPEAQPIEPSPLRESVTINTNSDAADLEDSIVLIKE